MTTDNRAQADALLAKTQVMSIYADLHVAAALLNSQFTSPFRAIEFGAGAGGWPKAMHELGVNNVDWSLVENFDWMNDNYQSDTSPWPRNKDELLKNCDEFDPSLEVSHVYDVDVSKLINSDILVTTNQKFDLLRIDCDISKQEFEYIITNCLNTNAVVFIDDARTNCGLYRIMLGAMAVIDDLLYPVWYGEKESMFCTNYDRSRILGDAIAEFVDNDPSNIHANKEYKLMFGKDWYFTTTTNYSVYIPKINSEQ